jgi:hypothetical protein
MKKSYIVNLKYETRYWQLWFVAEDNASTVKKWENCLKNIPVLGESCNETNEFYKAAVSMFCKAGFTMICK